MSKYLHDTRALFLHIPRTGGTWIKTAIHQMGFVSGVDVDQFAHNRKNPWLVGPEINKHRPLQLSMRLFTSKIDFVFTCVRHPLSLYQSWWWDMQGRDVGKPFVKWHRHFNENSWHPLIGPARNWHSDFNEWARQMVENEPGYVTRLYETFVGPGYGGETCAYIARTETIVDDFFEVMGILGYGDRLRRCQNKLRSMGPKNASTGMPEWEEETKNLVGRSERVAIRRFYGPETIHRRRYAELSEPVLPGVRRLGRRFFWSAGPGKAPFDLDDHNPSWNP